LESISPEERQLAAVLEHEKQAAVERAEGSVAVTTADANGTAADARKGPRRSASFDALLLSYCPRKSERQDAILRPAFRRFVARVESYMEMHR
jgi:hypothetical protein